MLKKISFILVAMLGLNIMAKSNNFELKGEFKDLKQELAQQNKYFDNALDYFEKVMRGGKSNKQDKIFFSKVKNNPENFYPPVLYVLANYEFNNNAKDGGLFWFYLAQLRARSDANK